MLLASHRNTDSSMMLVEISESEYDFYFLALRNNDYCITNEWLSSRCVLTSVLVANNTGKSRKYITTILERKVQSIYS